MTFDRPGSSFARGKTSRRSPRRWHCRGLALVFFLIGFLGAGCRSQTHAPDIVLYVVDTLRADALGFYSGNTERTPHFNRVAHEGARFERAYANSSWTRPSVASLLTGQYPQTHGARTRFDRLREDLPTLPELLRSAGYQTVAIVANPNLASAFGFGRGFDHFIELYEPVDRVRPIEPQELIAPGARVVERALEWWRNKDSRPLFLFVFSIDPHAPYTPPPPYDRKYDPDYSGDYDGSFASLFRLAIAGQAADPRDLRHVRALYDGEVAYADEQFGRLLAELDRAPSTRAPILIVTSDHGEEFLEHGKLDHGQTLFEEVIRIPLVIRWRGRIEPQDVNVPVSLVDVFPTLLELAGVPPPRVAGSSLAAALLNRHSPSSAPILLELSLTEPPWDGGVFGTRKLLRHGSSLSEYDLGADPRELAPYPPRAELVERFQRLLAANQTDRRTGKAAVDLPPHAREALKALGYGEFFREESPPPSSPGSREGGQ